MTTLTMTPQHQPPSVWYDYTVQAWVCGARIAPCGHPAAMRPTCCYAGAHAGESADLTHYTR